MSGPRRVGHVWTSPSRPCPGLAESAMSGPRPSAPCPGLARARHVRASPELSGPRRGRQDRARVGTRGGRRLPSAAIIGLVLRVGLTGGIGAGKSAVARRLAQRGAVIIDADKLA